MKPSKAACLLLTGLLAGCATEEQTIAHATREARDHCESEGKQFILTKTKIGDPSDPLLQKSVMVTGNCVGPGEPGYLPPEMPASSR